MRKFQYTVQIVEVDEPTIHILNEMGNKGWEAIDFYRATSNHPGYTMITFKREIVMEEAK